ncbi:glycoside hydrolase family 3 C-terminal domain-containing protein [Thalassotalea sp. Y01]|uniref:beta-glucosidase n=1 Tax=Thalassotalea sp. Y01 TaxID=2729613 RepID=UPI00145DF5B5|nr:glycoside hydrolase family 3 C-terminal domain-containing protein [Thalassotalea sp. Y01]NMP16378.1 glycosyl hydrolase [Thalassotalea sp. Y01]
MKNTIKHSILSRAITCGATSIFVLAGLSACKQSTEQNEQIEKNQQAVQTKVQSIDSADYQQVKQTRLAKVEQDVELLLAKLTLEEKVSLVHASGKFHVNAIERLGIPELWLSDGPHGVRYQHERDTWNAAGWDDDHATYLPHLTTVAASFDPEMAHLHGSVLGAEARHRGKDIILGPGVNLARLPLYGRNFEYMGEDPFLAASLVVPEVKGIQSQDVAANAKHYALNTQELNRIGVNAKPDERTLREVYLPAFEAAVKQGGVYSVMGAYNQYYGTNANQSKHLVVDILKGDWGFDGVLLTDWNVDINTYEAAVNGLDLEMGTNVESYDDYFLAQPFLQMLKDGKISESVVDDKVRRVLRLMHRVGMWDEQRLPGSRNTKAHQQAARHIASQGVVLLKNNGNILPLSKDIKNVLVLGPNADRIHGLGGGSSEVKSLYEITPLQGLKNYLGDKVNIEVMRARSSSLAPIAADYIASKHWTGTPAWTYKRYSDASKSELLEESWIINASYKSRSDNASEYIEMDAEVKPFESGEHLLKLEYQGQISVNIDGDTVLELDSDSKKTASISVNLSADKNHKFAISYQGNGEFVLGWDAPGALFVDKTEYTAAAAKADAVIYFGGLSHGDDREAIDRPDMKLPGSQDEVISNLLQANQNTVVFMVAGSAVEMPWVEQANALVWGWYGGLEAGNAFADVIFGDVNPSGKMPITLPKRLQDTAAIALNDYNATESLYKEGVFIGYRWFEQQAIEPEFVFGHGLSYTDFIFENIEISKGEYASDDDSDGLYQVSVDVKNTGKRAGAEVVQLYLQDVVASVERPIKELKGFAKVFLQPGESKQVSMVLSQRDLSFWSVEDNDWKAETGQFKVHLGASLVDIRLTEAFQYDRANK